jgi:hypothetical protein
MEEILTSAGAFIAAFVAMSSIYKIINDVVLSRSVRHREDYQFTKNYIEDLYNPDVHTFVLEKGFRALTNELYSIDEIKILLSYSEPTTALHLRSNSKEFIEFDSTNEAYKWKSRWESDLLRKLTQKTFLSLYVIFGFIAIYPLSQTFFGSIEIYTLSLITTLVFIGLAFYLLIKYVMMTEATDFMAFTTKQRAASLKKDIHE